MVVTLVLVACLPAWSVQPGAAGPAALLTLPFRPRPAAIFAWVVGLMGPFFMLLHKLKLMRVTVGA